MAINRVPEFINKYKDLSIDELADRYSELIKYAHSDELMQEEEEYLEKAKSGYLINNPLSDVESEISVVQELIHNKLKNTWNKEQEVEVHSKGL